MNFYAHHLGDYASDTAHLSMLEDGAYRRLLDIYYKQERPLPIEVAQVQRLARAQSKEERRAVEQVLREFFHETAEGWRHRRCDEEIAIAQEAADEKVEAKANEKERQRRHRERRKALFAALRDRDLFPRFDTSTETLQKILDESTSHAPVTRDKSVTSRDGHAPVTGNITACGDAHATGIQSQSQSQIKPKTTPSGPPDGGSTVWDFGKNLLAEQGLSLASAGSLIGSWLRDWDEPVVADAIRASAGKADAKAYIIAILNAKPRRAKADPVLSKLREEHGPGVRKEADGYRHPGLGMRWDSRGQPAIAL